MHSPSTEALCGHSSNLTCVWSLCSKVGNTIKSCEAFEIFVPCLRADTGVCRSADRRHRLLVQKQDSLLFTAIAVARILTVFMCICVGGGYISVLSLNSHMKMQKRGR